MLFMLETGEQLEAPEVDFVTHQEHNTEHRGMCPNTRAPSTSVCVSLCLSVSFCLSSPLQGVRREVSLPTRCRISLFFYKFLTA